MRVWRIERAEHVDDALSGMGARLFGGRWNSPGTSMVYTASSIALAALERFVHAPRVDGIKLFYALGFDLDDELARGMVAADPLPMGWRSREPGADSQRWGDRWASSAASAAAAVPSTLLPLDVFNPRQEFNVLLNPESAAIKALRVSLKTPYAFDARMCKSA
ncbi:MAG: RES family NAD+ phosphorylase [Lysobacter sp.]|nr:RES family NAD+ phosphorylase [Lysobacter sp.]MDQ3270198.1 RES family NAD+ phosphorylase [Pseudomonadota bacterium]